MMGYMLRNTHNGHNHKDHLPPSLLPSLPPLLLCGRIAFTSLLERRHLEKRLVPQRNFFVCVVFGVLDPPVVVVLTHVHNSTRLQLKMNIAITQKSDGVPKFFNCVLSAAT